MKYDTRNAIIFFAAAMAGAVGGCICTDVGNVAGIVACTASYVISVIGLGWSVIEIVQRQPVRRLPPDHPKAGPWWL